MSVLTATYTPRVASVIVRAGVFHGAPGTLLGAMDLSSCDEEDVWDAKSICDFIRIGGLARPDTWCNDAALAGRKVILLKRAAVNSLRQRRYIDYTRARPVGVHLKDRGLLGPGREDGGLKSVVVSAGIVDACVAFAAVPAELSVHQATFVAGAVGARLVLTPNTSRNTETGFKVNLDRCVMVDVDGRTFTYDPRDRKLTSLFPFFSRSLSEIEYPEGAWRAAKRKVTVTADAAHNGRKRAELVVDEPRPGAAALILSISPERHSTMTSDEIRALADISMCQPLLERVLGAVTTFSSEKIIALSDLAREAAEGAGAREIISALPADKFARLGAEAVRSLAVIARAWGSIRHCREAVVEGDDAKIIAYGELSRLVCRGV